MPASTKPIEIIVVDKESQWLQCKEIRIEVFVEEQEVPLEEEFDGLDDECIQYLAYLPSSDNARSAAGTARLRFPKGGIAKAERIAVRKSFRQFGVGRLLMEAIEKTCRDKKIEIIMLSSQVQAIPFYERQGYIAEGEEYMDCDIPHRDMFLTLASRSNL